MSITYTFDLTNNTLLFYNEICRSLAKKQKAHRINPHAFYRKLTINLITLTNNRGNF